MSAFVDTLCVRRASPIIRGGDLGAVASIRSRASRTRRRERLRGHSHGIIAENCAWQCVGGEDLCAREICLCDTHVTSWLSARGTRQLTGAQICTSHAFPLRVTIFPNT